tara:strand:+ start:74 stop:1141 length:1068 start_codon:yes stop_codon:yes gene_type:complete
MTDLDSAWDDFLQEDEEEDLSTYVPQYLSFEPGAETAVVPKCSDIYISTKTKIAYLNQKIDLNDIFWKIQILLYHEPKEGIIKKQMKFICHTKEELSALNEKLVGVSYLDEFILTSIDNPDSGRIKFKDVRKISIGVNKKDILSYRCKKKSAFYNCFVLIMRVFYNEEFHEIHVKVFNTGKLEIPGIKDNNILTKVLDSLVETLKPMLKKPVFWTKDIYTVLINSNFNCGFYINRARLFEVIQFKYNISSVYDPCSYPGIQCKFYYDTRIGAEKQTGSAPAETSTHIKKVSFMIFRTGSVLIVGKCDESELTQIYEFLKKLLKTEYEYIVENVTEPIVKKIERPKKLRRKTIMIK